MTDTSEIARIAAGMSEAARHHIDGPDDIGLPAGVAVQFVRHRLIEIDPDDDNGWRWSALGLAARAYLEKQG